jgi:hypothetical protein
LLHASRRLGIVGLLAASALVLPSPGFSQQPSSKSAAFATELTQLLAAAKLEHVAAHLGADPDQFVSAMLQGSQLLVVKAKFTPPDRMNFLLKEKKFNDAYLDLNGTPDRKTKLFIFDLGANGLQFRRQDNQPFDMVDLPGQSVSFDGEWGRAKMSEDDYKKVFESTDEQYSQMLQALIATLKK